MLEKDLNKHQKGLKSPKAETVIIKGTITKNQRQILQTLIGIIGSNEQDVVGKILTLWLYNEGYLNNQKVNPKNKNDK